MRRVDPNLYTKKYYLTDATGYKEFKHSYGRILEPRLSQIVKLLPQIKGKRVLDIGCGRGELVFWAAKSGAKLAHGIDYAKSAISLAKIAQKHWPKKFARITEFRHLDAKEVDKLKNKYDVVIMTEFWEHIYHPEQKIVLQKIRSILTKEGKVFIHTAPSKWFMDITYRLWCYPISSLIVFVNNILSAKKYPNIAKYKELRPKYHKIMHVAEPDYFSLKKIFKEAGYKGKIRSTNITINKPVKSWKDSLFNFIVYLSPLSNYPPLNIFWGNDFYTTLTIEKQ